MSEDTCRWKSRRETLSEVLSLTAIFDPAFSYFTCQNFVKLTRSQMEQMRQKRDIVIEGILNLALHWHSWISTLLQYVPRGKKLAYLSLADSSVCMSVIQLLSRSSERERERERERENIRSKTNRECLSVTHVN